MLRYFNPLSWFIPKDREETNKENENFVETIKFDVKYLELYIELLRKDQVLRDFLHFDSCYILADKYLLAISFAYFIRLDLKEDEYTRLNFFSALYLAHAMEEDDENLKSMLVCWSDGKTHKERNKLLVNNAMNQWRKMNYRALVNKKTCEVVMQAIPNATIWKRFRPEVHAGAIRSVKKCYRCYSPFSSEPFCELRHEDDLYETQARKKIKFSELLAIDNTEEIESSESEEENVEESDDETDFEDFNEIEE